MATSLTIKQERFINAYIENENNATAAARTAGYTGSDAVLASTASQLLRNPKVASRIGERLKAMGATRDRIIGRWIDLGFMDLDDPRLMRTEYDRNGNIKSQYRDYNAMNKALENMAKSLGMFKQEVDINISNQPVRQLLYLAPDNPLRATITQQIDDGGARDDEKEQEI